MKAERFTDLKAAVNWANEQSKVLAHASVHIKPLVVGGSVQYFVTIAYKVPIER